MSFDMAGNYLSEFDTTDTGPGTEAIVDFDINGGYLYIPKNIGAVGVNVFDLSGTLLSFISRATAGEPLYCVVYGGEIYTSYKAFVSRIDVQSTSGTLLRTWNTASRSGSFGTNLFSVDTSSDTVNIFNTTGTLIDSFGTSGSGSGEFQTPRGVSVYGNSVFVTDSIRDKILIFSTSGTFIREFGTSGGSSGTIGTAIYVSAYGGKVYVLDTQRRKVLVFTYGGGVPQTTFYSYTESVKTSLGTPDGGVSVPSYNALYANEADLVLNHITDMRTAIEALAPFYTNPATANAYNWTSGSADNLYRVAMGDRTAYGATGGVRYDWTRNSSEMSGDFAYDIDIGEIDACITQLEAS